MTPSADEERRDEALRDEAAAWLGRLRGPSTAQDHAAFEKWFHADPEHAEAYEAVLQSWETFGLVAATPTGQARQHLAGLGSTRWRYALIAVAATVVIVLLAFGANGVGIAGGDPAHPVEFASLSGEIRTVELADGSRITLDRGSLLQSSFSADQRRVMLVRGRARFAVAHESARPFIVATTAGLVIAHGTLFDVAVAGEHVTVSLLEGSIEVRPAATKEKPSSGSSQMLAPGQRVVLSADKTVPLPTPFAVSERDWPSGMASFVNAPLGEVIAAANRSGASQIVLTDSALGRLRFTGTFKAAETEQLSRMVATMFDLRSSRAPNGGLLLAPRRSTANAGQKVPG